MAWCLNLLVYRMGLGYMTSKSLFKFMIRDHIIPGVNVYEKAVEGPCSDLLTTGILQTGSMATESCPGLLV